jgi:hypothetical protein
MRGSFRAGGESLSDVALASTRLLRDYLGQRNGPEFADAAAMDVAGTAWNRVLEICRLVGADEYLSALGGLRYLNHEEFEAHGVDILYPEYDLSPWPQMHGDFDPYVSSLDLVANCGKEGSSRVECRIVHWRDALDRNP